MTPYGNINEQNQKAWELRYADRPAAEQLAKQAWETALRVSDELNAAYATLTLAQLNFWKTSSGEALQEVLGTVPVFKKVKETLGASRAHCISAGIYDQFGQYDQALRQAQLAVKIAELNSDALNRAECYTMLGQVNSRISDYTQALLFFEKGLVLREQAGDHKAVASSLNLIARNQVLAGNYTEAEKQYERSLALRKETGDTGGIPWTYLGLASLYSHKGEWEKSLELYSRAEQSNEQKEKRFELLCLIGKGKNCLELGREKESAEALKKAMELAGELKILSLEAEASQLLSQCYERSGDFEKALAHHHRFSRLNQEILSSEKVNMLKHQQVAFSVEKAEQQAEIERLKNVELKAAFDKIALQHHQLEEKSKEIKDSISYAKRIQDAYLPPLDAFKAAFPDSFVLFQPRDIVSGDFYWYHSIAGQEPGAGKGNIPRLTLFAAADCTGHGVPGAIMSVICCNALNEAVKKGITRPDLVLNEVREQVINAFKKQGTVTQKDGMDIALASIQRAENGKIMMQCAGANNPLWLVRKTGGLSHPELVEIKGDKQPVGMHEVMDPFTLNEMTLEEGDCLYSFSDGYADQFGGPFGKKFKYKPLKELLVSINSDPMRQQHDTLLQVFSDWKKELEQIDDVCMIGVRV